MKYLLLLILLTHTAQAAMIKDKIRIGNKQVTFWLETETGDYALDLNTLLHPQFAVEYTDGKKPNCDGEENFSRVGGRDIPVEDYSFKRALITVELKLIDEVNSSTVEENIIKIAKEKGYQLVQLSNKSAFYVEDIALSFEWQSNSIVGNTKVPLAITVERDVNNQLSKAQSDKLVFTTRVHSFVCDLQQNAVKISVSGGFGTYNRMRKAGALSTKQIQTLHTSIKAKEKTYNLGVGEDLISKAVRASAVLAIESKNIGVSDSFITSDKYISLFSGLFSFIDYKVSNLVASDYSSLSASLAIDSEAQTEETMKINIPVLTWVEK